MTQDLISGYAAYAEADELVAATGQAPATPVTIAISTAFSTSLAASAATVGANC
ncbi:LxmA leader domain family RiPP [Streptomyces sp. DW26H14]|uniref:LxmA leader domain family RiPP n=1 Tax=Streptomyces sp. DW26H14 TaxID=3435395 RepID=UPI00403E0ABF